jgi:hypothetical protein
MVGELEVSPLCPPSRTVCPASPSLQWVPWASVPHLPRYCAPLRLPAVPLGSLRFRSLPNTLSASSVCVPCGSLGAGSSLPTPGLLVSRYPCASGIVGKETTGSPKFPRFPCDDMLRSPQTPVVSCPPRPCAVRTTAFHSFPSVGFPSGFIRDYPLDHHYTHFGALSRSLSSRYPRLRTAPREAARGFATELLARRCSGGTGVQELAPTGKQ